MKKSAFLAILLLLVAAAPAAHAAFPGGNGKIAFGGSRDGSDFGQDLWVMNSDGTGASRLFQSTGTDWGPNWSPDGRRLTFETNDEVGIMNADGSAAAVLASGLPGPQIGPSWSPDGKRIAFWTNFPGPPTIWVMNDDGSDAHLIREQAGQPAWSPDRNRIAYVGLDGDLHTMNPDGAGDTNLTPGSREGESNPDWSPDGSKLVFEDANVNVIQTIQANGTGRVTLSQQAGNQPVWSPDGTKIAFRIFTIGSFGDIAVMNADGTALTNITNTSEFESQPSWQPLTNAPPDCSSVTAAPDLLFPANRRLVDVTLSGGTDPDGDAITLAVTGVTQDEPVRGRGDTTRPDARLRADRLQLRAERNPRGDGRVYVVAFTASDGDGGDCSGTAEVSVPRQKHKPAVDSAPPSYDSFGQ
jgi:dipeptidyl aminopeptidase/acylaminoacyl peptidase